MTPQLINRCPVHTSKSNVIALTAEFQSLISFSDTKILKFSRKVALNFRW